MEEIIPFSRNSLAKGKKYSDNVTKKQAQTAQHGQNHLPYDCYLINRVYFLT